MLRNFTPRLYQEKIFSSAVQQNTLVVLPTGLGKTAIALMMVVHRLQLYPTSKVLILAPTKPLVEQHMNYFMEKIKLHDDSFALFTGQVTPSKRAELWKKAKIIFSTPQGLENDIISSRINLAEVSLMVFDEAHRATGDYSYVFVASRYNKLATYSRILALTASPGSDKAKIEEVCNNLLIEHVEARTQDDADVKPYVQETSIVWKEVELTPQMKQIQTILKRMHKERLDKIKLLGYVDARYDLTKKQLLSIMLQLQKQASEGEKTMELLKSISLLSEIMKLSHALELLESQGIASLYAYIKKIQSSAISSKVKAIKNLVADVNFKSIFIYTKKMIEDDVEHPKMAELKKIVSEYANKRIIIFTQYRETGKKINEEVNNILGCSSKLFVGQTKKGGTGLSQKEQLKTLQEFRTGAFNCIVMTSVGEEGLDIPQVDLVLFYEPIPSAVRSIQRRGRTGRLDEGHVIVLVAKGTRDEGYRWSSFHKEKRMIKLIKDLKRKRTFEPKETELTISAFQSIDNTEQVKKKHSFVVFIDYREKNSLIVKELLNNNISIDLKKLAVGDYVLGPRVVVEYKRVPDFVDSIIDGRLLHQIKQLKEHAERPLIVVEGTEDLYSLRRVTPTAIQGMLATITISYGIPIIYTKNTKETISFFLTIIKREQEHEKNKADDVVKEFSMHSTKPMSLKEQQEYLVSALPGIGPTLAKPLLKEFRSVFRVFSASVEQLQNVNLIGKKKAQDIRNVLDTEYFEWKTTDD